MFNFSALEGDVRSTAPCGLWMRLPLHPRRQRSTSWGAFLGPKRVPGGFSSSYSPSQSFQGVPALPAQPSQPQIPVLFIPWLAPGWSRAHPHRTQPPPPALTTLSGGALPKPVTQLRAPTGPTAHGTGKAEPGVTSSSPAGHQAPRGCETPGAKRGAENSSLNKPSFRPLSGDTPQMRSEERGEKIKIK